MARTVTKRLARLDVSELNEITLSEVMTTLASVADRSGVSADDILVVFNVGDWICNVELIHERLETEQEREAYYKAMREENDKEVARLERRLAEAKSRYQTPF